MPKGGQPIALDTEDDETDLPPGGQPLALALSIADGAALPGDEVLPEGGEPLGAQPKDSDQGLADDLPTRIAGVSVLKGLLLYGATFTFAGLYAYFMAEIASAPGGVAPRLDATMVSAAAALAGVLGSAFALVIGVRNDSDSVNGRLRQHLHEAMAEDAPRRKKILARIRQALSIEAGGVERPSIPLTVGIWVYAAVAAAVAITYFLNQAETPDTVRALAVAFAGYVLALVTAAYGLSAKPRTMPDREQ